MITFRQADVTAIAATGRLIEHQGPLPLRMAARLLGASLAMLPAADRRTVATAVAELALRHAAREPQPLPRNDTETGQ